jgi:hypothetical protein
VATKKQKRLAMAEKRKQFDEQEKKRGLEGLAEFRKQLEAQQSASNNA